MNGPSSVQGGEKAALPAQDATSVMDPLDFSDLCLEYNSIPEAILRSIINNSLQPINII